jgi:type II secretion system protein J
MIVKGKKGFTLLEVLVASVIGAFIALVAVSTLRAVAAGRVRLDENIAASDELRFAAEMIRQDLANIYRDSSFEKMRLIGRTSEATVPASASLTARVTSNTKARPMQIEGHLYDVQYSIIEQDGKKVFVRRKCPVVGDEEDENITGGMLTTIAEDIIAFNVRYFDTAQWLEQWPVEAGELPALMEISLAAVIGDVESESPKTITSSFIVNFARLQQTDDDESSQITDIDDIDSAGSTAESVPSSGGDK